MSTFTGKFREYPLISADNFERGNLDSLAFFLSHCHKDHMVGLDSAALHHRLKASEVLFVSHCCLLDTALDLSCDFRLSKGDARRISFFHTSEGIKDIKSIYVDTTFCLPKMKSLPSRQQSREAVIKLMDRWFTRGPEYAVSLLCKGMCGFEYLLKEVAMNYRTKIHVSSERLDMYRYLPDMTPYFTTDGESTKIHACKWQANQRCDSDLPCGSSVHPSLKTKVLRIKPTTMWVAHGTEPMPKDFKRYDKGKKLWRVVHSMHASLEEIEDLVGYLRPYHVFPNVPPAGLDTLADAFERLKGLTRIQDCESCNQDESVEDGFRQHAAHLSGEGVTKDKQSLEEKAALGKIQLCASPKPNERVLAQCKELGLNDDEALTPPPKRRRCRRQGIALEEKISVSQDPQGSYTGKVCTSVSQETQGSPFGVVNTAVPQHSSESSSGKVDTSVSQHTQGKSSNEVKISVSQHTHTNEHESIKEGNHMILPKFEDNQARTTKFCENSWCPSETEKEAGDENRTDCRVSEVLSNTVLLEQTCHSQNFRGGIASHTIDHKPIADMRTISSISVSDEEFSESNQKYSQGSMGGEPRLKADFDVPPSPGHVKPLPDKLSAIHKLLRSDESISITNMLKF
ncbi:Protein artemis [Stylophora pistillata]|uniref:Protein artemis n=1 Tax=Stylophora pistillata TaxID=50429 RepID=A0A2B4RI53_STYPI|nr:Protein artemis [Stylophora pistillata]